MSSSLAQKTEEESFVKLTIDGIEVRVSKGTNLIEAARSVGIEIPHYCYHNSLSVAGNCRMCQVKVQGMPKLTIACNTIAADGMVVYTHVTDLDVSDAQKATLEFLLINHPLDCTICDQAGHCKLQDYYYQYSLRPSRFCENKERKEKAQPLGPEVIYDGERCILCTRCVRFCDEITQTGELGVFNRGDKSVVGVFFDSDKTAALDNPLSGTVVDLCPVGALTHRRWRFNSRIWFADQLDSICIGCSTGCDIKVMRRDNQIISIKARKNEAKNLETGKCLSKEWLCDEGRYGFGRFQPDHRLLVPMMPKMGDSPLSYEQALEKASILKGADSAIAGEDALVFLSPFLTLEEMWIAIEYAQRVMKVSLACIALSCKRRVLSKVEEVLLAPNYAPNIGAARIFNLLESSDCSEEALVDMAESRYHRLLQKLNSGNIKRVLFVGDGSLWASDIDEGITNNLRVASVVSLLPRSCKSAVVAFGRLNYLCYHHFADIVFPSYTVLEKTGYMAGELSKFELSNNLRKVNKILEPCDSAVQEWRILRDMLLKHAGVRSCGVNFCNESGLDKVLEDRSFNAIAMKEICRKHKG